MKAHVVQIAHCVLQAVDCADYAEYCLNGLSGEHSIFTLEPFRSENEKGKVSRVFWDLLISFTQLHRGQKLLMVMWLLRWLQGYKAHKAVVQSLSLQYHNGRRLIIVDPDIKEHEYAQYRMASRTRGKMKTKEKDVRKYYRRPPCRNITFPPHEWIFRAAGSTR